MQAKSILMVLSAMALVTACANDETIEINYGESISLSAVAGKTTRTGSEATTTNSIRNFHVLPLPKELHTWIAMCGSKEMYGRMAIPSSGRKQMWTSIRIVR